MWQNLDVDSLGERIRKVRRERKLTQADVGKLLERSQAQISTWEKGKDTAQYDELLAGLVRFAQAANVSLDYLITGHDVSRPLDAREAACAFAAKCGMREEAIEHARKQPDPGRSAREWFEIIQAVDDDLKFGRR